MITSTQENRNLPFTQMILHDFSQSPQWSKDFTIGIVLRGHFDIHYQEELLECQPHDILFFPPFELWTITSHSKSAEVFQLRVESEYISHLCPEIINVLLKKNQVKEDLKNPVFVSLCRDFAALIANEQRRELCTPFKLLSSINHILTTVFESFGEFQKSEPKNTYMADRISATLTYISNHYTEKIGGGDIAKHLGLHPAYFSSFFHRQFGIGFVEYLNTYRINQSLPVLLRTDRSIMEIALDHGFSNHKTYAAAFRRVIGMSPTEYRRAHRSENLSIYIVDSRPDASHRSKSALSFFDRFLDAGGNL